ncbi:hypothetical protein ACLOJK_034217, partial [Asimina triloba]
DSHSSSDRAHSIQQIDSSFRVLPSQADHEPAPSSQPPKASIHPSAARSSDGQQGRPSATIFAAPKSDRSSAPSVKIRNPSGHERPSSSTSIAQGQQIGKHRPAPHAQNHPQSISFPQVTNPDPSCEPISMDGPSHARIAAPLATRLISTSINGPPGMQTQIW